MERITVTEGPTHSDGDVKPEAREADDCEESPAEQAKARELEMEKTGEENAA